MAQVVPAILEGDLDAFLHKSSLVEKIPGVRKIQVDFSDGKFTAHSTISMADLQTLNPIYEWEAHLMLENPDKTFLDAKILGFNSVIFHYESTSAKSNLKNWAEEIRKLKMSPGLAINPETHPSDIAGLAEEFDQILVMGVHPGVQGAKFLPETIEKVKELKNRLKKPIIEVDGGVDLQNIQSLVESGAELLVTGSALMAEPFSPADNFNKLSQIAAKIVPN